MRMAPNVVENAESTGKRHSSGNREQEFPSLPTSESTSVSQYLPQPPDGAWGWVIVFASFVSNGLVDGMCSTFGVFLPVFLDYFQGSQAKTALAGSLLPGLFMMSGPLVSGLVNHFGCRVVTMAGGLIAASAFVLSTFSPNVNVFIVSYGVMGGVGLGFIYLPAMVMVSYYFERRRSLAMGISMSGSGVGMLFMAPISAFLLERNDWKYALVILSGIMLQSLVLGSLMRPLETIRKDSASTDLCTSGDEPLAMLDDSDSVNAGSEVSQAENETCYMEVETDYCADANLTESSQSATALVQNDVHAQAPSKSRCDANEELHRKALLNVMIHQPVVKDVKDSTFLKHKLQGDHIKNWEHGHMPHMSQSCYELQIATPKLLARRKNPLLNIVSVDESASRDTSSCYELTRDPRSYRPIEDKQRLKAELLKPLSRRDVFYSGSIQILAEYRSQPDLHSYVKSVTVVSGIPDGRVLPCCACVPDDARSTLAEMLDISVLANPYLVLISLGNFFIQIGYFIPIVFLAPLAASVGIESRQAASLISIIGIMNSLGRALAGALANIPSISSLHLNNMTLVAAGVSTMLAPLLCNSYASFVVYAALFGLNIAAFVPLSSIFLVKYLGLEKLTNAFGLLSLVRGFSTMIGAPIAGLLLDKTRSYQLTFMFAGMMFVIAGSIHYLLPLVERYKKCHPAKQISVSVR